jgi:YGGT family
MTTERVDQTVVTEGPTPSAGPEPEQTTVGQGQVSTVAPQQTVRTEYERTTTSPGSPEMIRRVIVFVFGLIQLVIGLRIVLLLLDARTGNALVSGILDVSQVFVGPFEGILNTNALTSGGSMLDVAAVVAFVGWTILELIVIWAVGIFRREPA